MYFLVKTDISEDLFTCVALEFAMSYCDILANAFCSIALFEDNFIFQVITYACVLRPYFSYFTGRTKILLTFHASEKRKKNPRKKYTNLLNEIIFADFFVSILLGEQ